MMPAVRLMAVASLAIILLTGVEVSRADVSPATYPLGGTTWTLASTPTIDFQVADLMVTYKNNLNTTLEGFVWIDIRNTNGQTLQIDAALEIITAGQNLTAGLRIWGTYIPFPANYTYTVFATSVSGVAISNSTSVSYYVQ